MSDEKEKNYMKDPKILMSFGAGALTSGLGFHFFKKSDSQQIADLQKEKNELLQKNKTLENEKKTLQSENNTLQNVNQDLQQRKNNPSQINTQELSNLKFQNTQLQNQVDKLKQENKMLIEIPRITTDDTTNEQQKAFEQALQRILMQLNLITFD